MQTKLIIVSFLLAVTKVLAGGYAGALDRVWLFYAYQIDGLNDPADRTLGWKCLSWDDRENKCRTSKKGVNGWVMCQGTMQPGRRCTFSELLNFIGGADRKEDLLADSSGKPLPLTDTNPDPEQTAKNVYAHFERQPRAKVPDWPGYRIIHKGDEDYMRSIIRVTDLVKKAADDGKNTDANKQLFQRFADTTMQIKTARVGDHGPYLISATENALRERGIHVEKESVGSGHSPIDPMRTWETVDWEKTMSQAVSSGSFSNDDVKKIMSEVRTEFYKDDTASAHRAVIRAFETSESKAKGCL
ncbi:hypothetical protein GQX73_g7082 [Xylaria multiplex]|uniref:Uncharacterized protein n=1 Tax=Xylaria multiplex TaxID=323545 RepID=A0A7C8INY2_9PEZI|nr:hypothetical protein GQX73_g7082 [Xylaria multiplex]